MVDQGYKGHRLVSEETKIYITGQKRGITDKIKRELQRRTTVEPIIGHAKNDGRLDRNWLKGRSGDSINALLSAAGFHLRQLLRFLHYTKSFSRLFFTTLYSLCTHLPLRFSAKPAF